MGEERSQSAKVCLALYPQASYSIKLDCINPLCHRRMWSCLLGRKQSFVLKRFILLPRWGEQEQEGENSMVLFQFLVPLAKLEIQKQ